MLITEGITEEFWLRKIIIAEIENVLKERKAEDILNIKPKLVAPADGRVVGNNKVLDIIKLNAKINIPAKDNIKLIKFSNTIVNNAAVEDSKTVNIAKVDFKLDMLAGNFDNTVLNKDRDVTVNKVVGVIEIKLSGIDVDITVF